MSLVAISSRWTRCAGRRLLSLWNTSSLGSESICVKLVSISSGEAASFFSLMCSALLSLLVCRGKTGPEGWGQELGVLRLESGALRKSWIVLKC